MVRHDAQLYPTNACIHDALERKMNFCKNAGSIFGREGILTSGVIGLFTGPHQTSFSELGSFTIRLSEGDRPVFAPEYADSAPDAVMADPVS